MMKYCLPLAEIKRVTYNKRRIEMNAKRTSPITIVNSLDVWGIRKNAIPVNCNFSNIIDKMSLLYISLGKILK